MNTTNVTENAAPTVEIINTIFEIPSENMHRFREKMEALARRAVKLGCTPPSFKVGASKLLRRRETDLDGEVYEMVSEVFEVTVSGESPRIEGWTFVAVRDHAEGGAPLIRAIGHEAIPEHFRAESTDCDHCRMDRKRKETFVLRHVDGRWIQVGRSCIRDFLGSSSPENIAACAELLADISDAGGDAGEGGGKWRFTCERYLAFVSIVIRTHGWLSRTAAQSQYGVQATAELALGWMIDGAEVVKKGGKSKYLQPTVEDRERGKSACAWAMAITDDEIAASKGDYLYNVRTAASREILTDKIVGIVASIIPAWDKECAKKREVSPSNHVGTVGDRFTVVVKKATKKRAEEVTDTRLKLVVQDTREFDGAYGPSYKNTMVDEKGNIFVWWSGTCLEVGATYLIGGTVKAHGEYNGRKETVLTRCGALQVKFDVESAAA